MPDDAEEAVLVEMDPTRDQYGGSGSSGTYYDEDEGGHGHGQNVRCQSQ